MSARERPTVAEWLAGITPPDDEHGKPDTVEELRALLVGKWCACAPHCAERASEAEYSPYMNDYCDGCTAHRCNAEGRHIPMIDA